MAKSKAGREVMVAYEDRRRAAKAGPRPVPIANDTGTRTEITEAAARALWVDAWAREEEEAGRRLPRGDLMDSRAPDSAFGHYLHRDLGT